VSGERQALGKLTNVESLRSAMTRWNLTAAIPSRETLEIDNSTLTADEVARRIAAHFSLPVLDGEVRGGTRS